MEQGPHHHDQPVILPMQHARDGAAAAFHQRQGLLRGGQPLLQQGGCDQGAHGLMRVSSMRVLSRVDKAAGLVREAKKSSAVVAVWPQSCQFQGWVLPTPVSKSQKQ